MRQESVVSEMAAVDGVGELAQVTLLMKSYKDAIENCASLPSFSVFLGLKTLVLAYLWGGGRSSWQCMRYLLILPLLLSRNTSSNGRPG